MVLKFYSDISAQLRADRYIPVRDDYRNHRGIPALPFSAVNRKVPRPKPEGYPIELKTIGDHIRKWRMDNNLLQSDIASILKVCEDSVVGWEVRGTTPCIRQMPGIIRMIGYFPVQIDTSTFGEKITYYRYMLGLTPEEFGQMVSANSSTVRSWEAIENMPYKRRRKAIDIIISKL